MEVAEDGAQALEMIENGAFDLVLLDIMMPGIDGYEVLEKLREDHGPDDLPVIMATAKSESEDIVAALKMGANDYVTKPFDFPVVLARVSTQLALKKIARRAGRRPPADAEGPRSGGQRSSRRCCRPRRPRWEAQCAWRYVPCDELAGDTLNVIPLGDGITGLFVLDVSGHGVPSSLLSVTLSRLSRVSARFVLRVVVDRNDDSGARRAASPAEVADELSRRFPYDLETHQYFTMVYGVLDVNRHLFTYVSAGHPPVVHLRSGGESSLYTQHRSAGRFGSGNSRPREYEEVEIPLEPGDRLYLFSDGIPEAHESGGEEYGNDRTAQHLQSCFHQDLDESITSLLAQVWEWGGGSGPGDDVSILAVEIED